MYDQSDLNSFHNKNKGVKGEKMIFDEETQQYKPKPVPDKTLVVKKIYEFQFYPDFARL